MARQATEQAPSPRCSRWLQLHKHPRTLQCLKGLSMLERGQSRWSTYPQGPQGQNTQADTQLVYIRAPLLPHREAAVCEHWRSRSEHTQAHNCSDSHTHSDATMPGTPRHAPPISNHDITTAASSHVRSFFLESTDLSQTVETPAPWRSKDASQLPQAPAPLPHASGGPCPRPPTTYGRKWARSTLTSGYL